MKFAVSFFFYVKNHYKIVKKIIIKDKVHKRIDKIKKTV